MCGVAGIIVYGEAAPVSRRDLQMLSDAQRHRGPDDQGTWLSENGRLGLGHRRLSIIDLSPLGHQPMFSSDGRFCVVYNGEIYNFPELRRELQDKGHEFVSTSDTEVLLHGYRQWGIALLERLRGMFAFALHDTERQETLLVRDSLGIKPLYVADDGRRLVFASEVRALKKVISDHEVDPEGLASYLSWGSIAPPRTLYRSIRALPPASWLRVCPGRVEGPEVYYRLEDELGHADFMDPETATEVLRAALLDSVTHHMVADVPVGSFLSGGVDSSALVGLMAEVHDGPIRTVTLSMDAPELDEGALARRAATLYATEHHEIPISIEEVRERIPAAVRSLDQPSIDGVNTYFVSEAAARTGLKVAVSGVGGDELFGGYGTFRSIPFIERAHARAAAVPGAGLALRGAAALMERLPRSRLQGRLARALGYGADTASVYFATRGLFRSSELRALLAPEIADAAETCDPRAELNARVRPDDLPEDERVCALEFRQYLQCQLLRDTDATAMSHSLEVRTPLVDRELFSAAARVPAALRRAGPAKRHLRSAPLPPVPEALWARKKQGFTLPFDSWLRSGGISTDLPDHPLLRRSGLEAVATDFFRGRIHWSRLWALVVLREFLC